MIPAVAAFAVSALVAFGVAVYWQVTRLREELELAQEAGRGVAEIEDYLAMQSGGRGV